MNPRSRNHLRLVALATGICLAATAPALAEAWGLAFDCSLSGSVNPQGQYDQVVWNDLPENWLLHAEAEAFHMCPPLFHDYDVDSEIWDPTGDGWVGADAEVPCDTHAWGITASIGAGGLVTAENVYSRAHRDPPSWSAAAGLAQHDDLFWIEFTGPGDPPEFAEVSITLQGAWNLEGDSKPDEYWWADVLLYGEIYDEGGGALGLGEYHFLEGPGFASDGGNVNLEMQVELPYDTPYALRFYIDAESYAVAPEPGTLILLLGSGLIALRRRARTAR